MEEDDDIYLANVERIDDAKFKILAREFFIEDDKQKELRRFLAGLERNWRQDQKKTAAPAIRKKSQNLSKNLGKAIAAINGLFATLDGKGDLLLRYRHPKKESEVFKSFHEDIEGLRRLEQAAISLAKPVKRGPNGSPLVPLYRRLQRGCCPCAECCRS